MRLLSGLVCLLLLGCELHEHEHQHDAAGHEPHQVSQHAEQMPHENTEAGPAELDHNQQQPGHAHRDQPRVLTHFSDVTELFVEFPPLVAGQEAPFLAHLTRLDDFKPVQQGLITIALVGGGVPAELFTVEAPIAAGIFRPLVQPQHAVKRQLILTIQADGLAAKHDLGEYQVFASAQEAQAATPAKEEPEDAIHYLKEQQWQADFATAAVQQRQLRASIQATGTLRPRADGEAYLSATSAGHLHSRGDFPYVGMGVEIGQVLVSIIPRLGLDSDLSTLRAARDKARSQYELARHERDRLQQLWADKVVALHRLHEAESALEVAKAELDAAQRRYQQSSGDKPLADSGIPVLAPISGVLAQVQAAPGSYVAEGATLFHIVNLDRLWLEARIAEADIGRLQQPEGAWFTLEGFAQTFDTFQLNGSLVALGGVIDTTSRTVPLIFAFDNPDHRLRSGMFANVRVFTGESQAGLAVPRSAIFDDGGEEVVYVMLGGETFQRRRVRLGIDEADWVQVLSGVAPGERVVSKGAYLLRLAASAPLEAGHGHVH